ERSVAPGRRSCFMLSAEGAKESIIGRVFLSLLQSSCYLDALFLGRRFALPQAIFFCAFSAYAARRAVGEHA
ncbi:MAG: hypothetical protein ABFD69_14060, partial [Candidatus Sumerlaeia bacterium]